MITHYHFVPINPSPITSLPQIIHHLRHHLQRSHIKTYLFTQLPLRNKDITILPFHPNNIKQHIVIIQPNPFPHSHQQILKPHQLKLHLIRYHHFLPH
ncbi:Mur ligase domain-containing protein, partial [Staphylococcus warneri]|uniref:Mur ligase domain-containing protein n=1 Tax=Staphylococcus warneri TaxID=1292 RepID=UPI0028CB80B9